MTERRETRTPVEQTYKDLVERLPLVTYSASFPDAFDVQFVSPQIEQLLGFPPERWIAEGLSSQRLHPDDGERVAAHFAALRENLPGGEIEYRARHADGHYVWLRASNVVTRGEAGGPTTLQGFLLDISAERQSERERAEAQRRADESLARVDMLIESSPVGLALFDRDRRFIRLNDRLAELDGVPVEAHLGRRPSEVLHDTRIGEVVEMLMEQVAETGDPVLDLEAVASDPDRMLQAGLLSIHSINDADGELVGFSASLVDATQVKQTQERLVALSYQNELLLRSAGEGILGLGADGAINFANPFATHLLGRPESELRGRNFRDVACADEEDDAVWAQVAATLTGGSGSSRSITDATFTLEDGRAFPVEATVTPIDEDGVVTGAVLVFRDMSEQRRMADQLRQAQKMEAVGQLAGGIAHDYNNTLTAIAGYADHLEQQLPSESEALRRDVHQIKVAAARAGQLTRQLLAFARQQVMRPKPISLNDVVEDARALLGPMTREDVQVVTELAPTLDAVLADPNSLVQALLNLGSNARDAMPDGGVITIETKNVSLNDESADLRYGMQPGRYVMLSVSDSGVGIPAHDLHQVFDAFYTTKEAGKGTGLGLPMVYGTVKQSGGYIFVDSKIGEGTRFTIYLPTVPVKSERYQVTPADGSAELAGRASGSERLLLVEDDDFVREIVVDLLAEDGYTVFEAADGEQALEAAAAAGELDLVVTDIVMPKMGGRELAEKLQAADPALLVLFTSGYTDDPTILAQLSNDRIAFIQKPFTPARLSQKVREILDEAHAGRVK